VRKVKVRKSMYNGNTDAFIACSAMYIRKCYSSRPRVYLQGSIEPMLLQCCHLVVIKQSLETLDKVTLPLPSFPFLV
jgi:hypothetical protein